MATPPDPRLPPELCDYVLDYFAWPHEAEEIEGKRVYTDIPALAASAQVCRGWLPRARRYLYSHIHIQHSREAFGLVSTLSQQPAIATQIREIDVAAQHSDHDYIPFLRLLPLASRLQHLTLYNLDFNRSYPSSQVTRIGTGTRSVTTLTLTWLTLASLADLLRLIRSFPSVTSLHLACLSLARETSVSTIAELRAQRACWAPSHLRMLEMDSVGEVGSVPAPIGGGILQLLGSNIEQLALTGTVSDHPRRYFPGCIDGCNRLTVFNFTAIRQGLILPNFDAPLEDPVSRWMCGALLDLPGAVRSPVLRSLYLVFNLPPYEVHWHKPPKDDPQEQPATSVSWEVTYRYLKTRGALLDEALGREFHDILVGMPAFPALASFDLRLSELSAAHDAAWWRKEVEARLPGVPPGVISVQFLHNPVGELYHYDQLWEPDPAPAPAPASV